MSTLNLCLDHDFTRELSGHVASSGSDTPSRRWKRLPGQPQETYECSMTAAPLADAQTMIALFRAVTFHEVFRWTAPSESTARAWKFVSFSGVWRSPTICDFKFRVRHVPGVAVPPS